jgi:hypothetical protein
VRTTLTLDQDVMERVKAEVSRSGKSFRTVVNECLRLALTNLRRGRDEVPPFVVRTRGVNDQYRLTFRWEGNHAYEVRCEDYHA